VIEKPGQPPKVRAFTRQGKGCQYHVRHAFDIKSCFLKQKRALTATFYSLNIVSAPSFSVSVVNKGVYSHQIGLTLIDFDLSIFFVHSLLTVMIGCWGVDPYPCPFLDATLLEGLGHVEPQGSRPSRPFVLHP